MNPKIPLKLIEVSLELQGINIDALHVNMS